MVNGAELVKWLSEFVVPLVAVVGSLLGILLALDQITAGSRLRRHAAFWRDMAQNPALQHDAAVFHSLEREAISKVIALQALPARILLLPAVLVTLATAVAASIGFTIGQIPATELTWVKAQEKTGEQGMELVFLIMTPVIIAVAMSEFLNLVLMRSQIAKAYLDGKGLEVRRFRRDDRSPIDALGCSGFLLNLAFSLGLACLAAAAGAFTSIRSQAVVSPPEWWLILIISAGALLPLLAGFSLFANVREITTREWQHPRPLPNQPRRPRLPAPLGSSRTVPRWGRPHL